MRRGTTFASLALLATGFVLSAAHSRLSGQAPRSAVTVFDGARLIAGDGSAPIENSAFIVENQQFTRVGRRGQIQVSATSTTSMGRWRRNTSRAINKVYLRSQEVDRAALRAKWQATWKSAPQQKH